MKKEYTHEEYQAMVGKLCRISAGVIKKVEVVGVLENTHRLSDGALFVVDGRWYFGDCEPLTHAEVMQYIYQPDPAKRTKDNLFVGLHPRWEWAAIDQDGAIFVFQMLPGCAEKDGFWFSGREDIKVAVLFDIEPWIDLSDPDAWKQSLIERPEGV